MPGAGLARGTGVGASRISDSTGGLRGRGLVREEGTGSSSGGRRPILLGVHEERAHILGVEIGATHITIVVTTLLGQILCAKRVPNPTRERPEQTLAQLFALIDWCFAQPGVDRSASLGLGVAVPSPVDPRDPGRLSRLILPRWSEVDLLEELSQRYERPTFVENDANAGAIAELWWGKHEDARYLTFVKVATGIGAGFVIDGELYRGAGGMAGEIGHMSFDSTDAPFEHAVRGRLTSLIGTEAIMARAAHGVRTRSNKPPATIQELVEATLDGDPHALRLVESVGEHLGRALAGLLNLMNPRVVVLGGELTELKDVLLDPLRVALRRKVLFTSVARTSVVTSRLGDSAIAAGAAALVLDAALDDLDMFPSTQTQGAA